MCSHCPAPLVVVRWAWCLVSSSFDAFSCVRVQASIALESSFWVGASVASVRTRLSGAILELQSASAAVVEEAALVQSHTLLGSTFKQSSRQAAWEAKKAAELCWAVLRRPRPPSLVVKQASKSPFICAEGAAYERL